MGRRDFFEEKKLKRLIYVFSITLVISIITFLAIFIMYNKKLKEESSNNLLELGKLNDIVSNEELGFSEETSSTSDKNISDSANKNAVNETTKSAKENDVKAKNVNKTPVSSVIENVDNTSKVENTTNTANSANTQSENTNTVSEDSVNQELSFIAPVSGEITKDFAMDTLIYSNTLEEWTTHNGIDIRAEKTSVVVASECGTVESIKTDPRYGLTITIAHNNGFKTIYSNLLTTEFVTEGQTVEKGQTIATVGESSSFEISDEPHLHFEMYKDASCVNPTIYLK